MSIKKVVVIGPESTGKSVLSQALAEVLDTAWVKEYARTYLEHLDRPYEGDDLMVIAEGQLASEDKLLPVANDVVICDTDLYVVKVWSEHSYNACPRWVLEQIAGRAYDLYLLTYIDVPWIPDPLREHGEESQRQYFYAQYKDIVMNSGVPWVEIKGTHEQRMETALAAIRGLRSQNSKSKIQKRPINAVISTGAERSEAQWRYLLMNSGVVLD